MTTLTRGSEVHHTHSLGRCYDCDVAFHWKRSDGVTCPKCGGKLSITTRRLRQGFLFLTPEDVKAIEDANGYSAIKPQIAKLNRRMTVLNREGDRLWDAFRQAERVPAVTPEGREYFTFDETLPEAIEAKAAYEAFKPQREAVDQERRALWRQVKGVPVAVSCLEGERRMVTHNVTPQPSKISEEAQAFRQAAEERAKARAERAAAAAQPEPVAAPIPEPVAPEAKPNMGVIKGQRWAGEVARLASITGTTAVLLDVRKGGEWSASETDGGRWVTVCDEHGTICQHTTRKLAEHHLADVTWCEACQDVLDAMKAEREAKDAAPAPAGRFQVTHQDTVLYQGDDEPAAWAAYGEAQAQHPSGVRITGTVPPAPVAERAPEATERAAALYLADKLAGAEPKAKSTHGGARKGAGRKSVGADVKAHSVSLPAEMVEGLKRLGAGNLSAGIRQMYRLMSGPAR